MIRSQPMKLTTILFTEESTWDTLNFLASADNIMFVDQHSYSKNKKKQTSDSHSARMIKRAEELLNLFEYLRPKIAEFKVKMIEPKLNSKSYIERTDLYCLRNGIEPRKYFETVEGLVKTRFGMVEEQLKNLRIIKENRVKLIETETALKEIEDFVPKELINQGLQNSQFN